LRWNVGGQPRQLTEEDRYAELRRAYFEKLRRYDQAVLRRGKPVGPLESEATGQEREYAERLEREIAGLRAEVREACQSLEEYERLRR
jgi:hypothetical protein